jgi:hypothetical protein
LSITLICEVVSDHESDAPDSDSTLAKEGSIMSAMTFKTIRTQYLYGTTYHARTWQAKFGCSPSICSVVWSLLQQSRYYVIENTPQHLLWLLYWLKTHPTWEEFENNMNINKKTAKKRIFSVLTCCYLMFTESSIVCLFWAS